MPDKRPWNMWKEIFSSLELSLTKRFNTAKTNIMIISAKTTYCFLPLIPVLCRCSSWICTYPARKLLLCSLLILLFSSVFSRIDNVGLDSLCKRMKFLPQVCSKIETYKVLKMTEHHAKLKRIFKDTFNWIAYYLYVLKYS